MICNCVSVTEFVLRYDGTLGYDGCKIFSFLFHSFLMFDVYYKKQGV